MSGDEILFLSHRLPWPPDRGDRIRSWHILKALAALRPVHVVAPLDTAADRRHVEVVERVAASVTTAVRSANKGIAVARALFSGRPASVELFAMPVLEAAVLQRLASGRIGTVFAFSGQMAHYVPMGATQRFVMDFVDMDSAKFAQQAAGAHGLSRLALQREAKRLRAFEIATAKRADASLFVSEVEAKLFTDTTGCPAQVIENGVDAAHFAPGVVEPVPANWPLIVFTGQMDYAPNIEAVTGFARDVLPQLAEATFAIVGRAPTPAVRALASERVIVTGEVSDTRPWIEAADIVVAPLDLARGIQNKVLEAMAMAKAIVVSPAAAGGIDADDGTHFVVADGAAQVQAIIALLGDFERRAMLGAAARERVMARYAWAARLGPLAGLIA